MQSNLEVIKQINLYVIPSTQLMLTEKTITLDSINFLQCIVEQKRH